MDLGVTGQWVLTALVVAVALTAAEAWVAGNQLAVRGAVLGLVAVYVGDFYMGAVYDAGGSESG